MAIQFRAFKAGETALAFDATADGAMGSDVTFAGASVLGELADGVVTVSEPTLKMQKTVHLGISPHRQHRPFTAVRVS